MASRRLRTFLTPSRRTLLAGLTASLASPALARAAPAGDWTPFDDSNGLIRFRGAINDQPVNMTLDSGAGRVVIDATFARSIGLEATGSTGTLHGLAESRPGGLSEPLALRFGAGILRLPNAVLADLSALALTGFDAPVLLGRDIFELAAVDIDFVGKRIAFRQGRLDTTGFRRFPLRASDDLREVEVAIEGRRQWAVVDLGSASPLALSQAYASRIGLLDGRPTSAWISSGVDGVTRYGVATAARIQLAGRDLANVPFDALPVWNRANTAPVNIGYPLMSRLGRVILDYRSSSLYVAEGSPPPQPFSKNRLGLALIALQLGYQVAFVAPGSPADRAGWKGGETIAKINGDPAMPSSARSALSGSPVVNFTMADGSPRRLTPADYY